MLAADTFDLVAAVEENLTGEARLKNLHSTTVYDNVPKNLEPKVREWLLKEGKSFHSRSRSFLSKLDRDTNPALRRTAASDTRTVRVAISTFGRTHDIEPVIKNKVKSKARGRK